MPNEETPISTPAPEASNPVQETEVSAPSNPELEDDAMPIENGLVDFEDDADPSSSVEGDGAVAAEVEAETDSDYSVETDRDDIRALLRASMHPKSETTQEIDDLKAERDVIAAEFGEDSPATKALTKAFEKISAIEQASRQREQAAEQQQIVSIMDSAIQKHGLKGYGDPKNRTAADWKALTELNRLATIAIETAKNRGKDISTDEAIRRADILLTGEDNGTKAVADATKVLKQRSQTRTVPSGRTPSTAAKKADPNADLDPKDPTYDARVYARSFR